MLYNDSNNDHQRRRSLHQHASFIIRTRVAQGIPSRLSLQRDKTPPTRCAASPHITTIQYSQNALQSYGTNYGFCGRRQLVRLDRTHDVFRQRSFQNYRFCGRRQSVSLERTHDVFRQRAFQNAGLHGRPHSVLHDVVICKVHQSFHDTNTSLDN